MIHDVEFVDKKSLAGPSAILSPDKKVKEMKEKLMASTELAFSVLPKD